MYASIYIEREIDTNTYILVHIYIYVYSPRN